MRRHNKRNISGFTMMEMMGAIAILVIAMAVAFPPVLSLQRDLRMMQLDAEAQQIYNSVQNRLSALKASGQADLLFGETSIVDGKITERPADYPSGCPFDSKDYGLYHLASGAGSNVARYLFTRGMSAGKPGSAEISSSLLSGSFIVEMSPQTGEVYSVYYWEPTGRGRGDAINPATGEGTGITWAEIKDLRSRAERAPYNIGYYGGGKLSELPQKKEDSDPDQFKDLALSLVNSEELYASVKSASIGKHATDPTFRISVVVEGLSYRNWGQKTVWERTYSPVSADPSTLLTLRPDNDEVDVILDSMRGGLSFAEITKDAGILPGSNVTVTIKVYCDIGQDDPSQPLREQKTTTNSLYQELKDNRVKVSSVRHLRNLDLRAACAKAGAGDLGDYTYNFARYTDIELEKDIEFDGNVWKSNPDCVSIKSRQDFSGNGYNPLKTFSPISASAEMEAQATYPLNGNGHVLKNFAISSDGDKTGIFKDMFFTVNNLNFQDPVVTGVGNVGVLTGDHRSGSIKNCHVFSTGKEGVGVVGTGDNVGGLIGVITGWVAVEDCSAAIDVTGASHVGGIAGACPNYTQLKDCNVGYVKNDLNDPHPIHVTATGDYAGGLTGYTTALISGNHVLADVSGASHVGGLAGEVSDGKIEDSRVGDLEDGITVQITGTGDYVGGLTGSCNQGGSGDMVLASVRGNSYVGGLVGSFEGDKFENCAVVVREDAAEGEHELISATGSFVGGAFGLQRGSVFNCTSAVSVFAQGDGVGGLVGWSSGGLFGSSVHGNVQDNGTVFLPVVQADGNNVGGLVGHRDGGGEIASDFAASYVSDGDGDGQCFGGLIGYANDGNVRDSYATGVVRGNAYVGGFAGYHKAGWWSTNFSTSSSVEGSNCVGGFVGYDQPDGNMQNCASYGKVSAGGGQNVGGFAGAIGFSNAYGSWANLMYLAGPGYNDSFNNWYETGIKKTYDEALSYDSGVARTTESHPFSEVLVGKNFPFRPVSYNGATLPYYGDWPTTN